MDALTPANDPVPESASSIRSLPRDAAEGQGTWDRSHLVTG